MDLHLFICMFVLRSWRIFLKKLYRKMIFRFVCLFFFSLVRIWYRSRCKTSFSRLYIMSAVVILVRRQHAQNREIVPRLSANLRTFFDNCCWCPVGQSCYKNRKLYFALNFAFRFGCSPYIYPVLSCDCRVWLPKSTNKGRFVDDGLVSLFPPPPGGEGGTPPYGLYGDIPLDRVWCLTCLKQGV